MIDHVSLHVSDFEQAKKFYKKALAPLNYDILAEYPEWSVAGLGANKKPDLWIQADGAKQVMHIAIVATSKVEVEQFYAAGLDAGGRDNGKPGYRKEYSPGYYAAFVLDPDGHNIEAVFHDPQHK